ncbi:MAG: aminopeptidase P N-terminal domain-containing protein [Acidobacteriaceae bacterium]|nr:aminopeptidase P N-terminal domain-containing protein [Acidobacteriaceae bacterium]
MQATAALLLLLATLLPAAVPLDEYRTRRAAVRERLTKDQAVLVLFGATEAERGDLRNRFFQEPNFFYLTGWTDPGATLLLTPTAEYLFLPPPSEVNERYTGKKLNPTDPAAPARTGVAQVLPAPKLEVTFYSALETAPKIYGLIDFNRPDLLRRLAGERRLDNAAPFLFPLRMRKSPAEISLLRASVDVTLDAHRAAWRRATAGLFEYQIGATMVNVYAERGCERNAYPPIVGSGRNSTILHYAKNDRRMDAGEVLLMDVGAECGMYAADITRTVPVNGKFSARQREIYEIVLAAQRAAIAAVRPGMTLAKTGEKSLYKIAYDVIEAKGYGKYFTHGLGHHIGLEVHDPGPPETPLEAGMVITIEPGIYIPEESLGVRIEDMVLVTPTGGELLSKALPREPDAVEKAMRHDRKP